MTTRRDYNASITTKGLDGTGLTEDITRKLYSRRGRACMAVVELVVDETSDKRDGTHKVALAIAGLELVLDHTDLETHLRDLQQTIYANRQREDGQLAIDEQLGGERTVADVVASGKSHRPHPFIPVDASQDNPICDVCGGIEASAVHSTQELITHAQDEDEKAKGDEDDPDPYDDVHAKRGEETVCGLRATVGKSLRRHEDREQVTCQACHEQLDALDIDASLHGDDDKPWGYPSPEPAQPATTVTDPFTAPTSTPAGT